VLINCYVAEPIVLTAISTPVELPDELAEVIKRFGIEAPDTPAIANDHPRAAPPM
jgi:hypothetical protein